MWPDFGNEGDTTPRRPSSCATMEGFLMSISRRFFLIGSGAGVTAAFGNDAVRFVER